MLNRKQLRVELARREMTYLDLARLLGKPPSTLSSWLNRRNPEPADLAACVEDALGLEAGALNESEEQRKSA